MSRRRSRAFEAALATATLVALAGTPQGWGARAAPRPAAGAAVIDRIVIEKAARRMTLLDGDRPVRIYRVSLGRGGLAPKTREGDRRTPEGDYRITGRNARSAYHPSLRIGYPTPAQVASARRRGVNLGGDIMIHGLPNGRGATAALYAGHDWTDGCIAVTDAEIEEIWRLTPDGAAVQIVP